MSNPIKLPPLPDNLISMSHGPFKPSLYDEGENYCARCHTRGIYLASRQCVPHIDPDARRARDLEIVRVVLEAAANVCKQRENAVEEMHGKQQPGTEAFWMTAGVTSASKRNAANIRALEFTHG